MTYWEMLLSKQRERGRDGLTLPFLIGAQNYLPDTYIRLSINSLIIEMIRKKNFETNIRFCTETQTLIFEIRKPSNAAYFPKYNKNPQEGVSVAINHKDKLGEDIDILVKRLVDEFQPPISNKNYSAEPNVQSRQVNWMPFTDKEDIPFILESLKAF